MTSWHHQQLSTFTYWGWFREYYRARFLDGHRLNFFFNQAYWSWVLDWVGDVSNCTLDCLSDAFTYYIGYTWETVSVWCLSSNVFKWYTPTGSERFSLLMASSSNNVFERRTSTGSELFPLLISLEATKFVLLSVLLLNRQFAQEFVQNLCRRLQKVQFRLTCVAQKHLCLSSLIYLDASKLYC